ncbi:DNA excision repair protein ERCC-6-like 2 isoform X1 [Octopus vulgaris]|uniref:DNA excision repair protein ERCC-6-like 2 isoform X1 n=1 Tax=Octopus vulgaris TaxID=6645 RepID=A0AA36FF26_OCTVU|nr:DNA excision repair protein ERCC-6-like 2 isoform X1 [Octopus vulgaris]
MDSERPSFDFSPVSEKTAFLLTKPGEDPVYEIPASINQYLRTYQREGVSFLLSHYQNNRGAILGDDMGLGKTVQVIAFISALLGKTGTKDDAFVLKPAFIKKMYAKDKPVKAHTCQPFLIIVPGNVLYNWVAELDTWGYFSIGKFHGKYKEDCLTGMKYDRFEVVLTTFETFRDNKKLGKGRSLIFQFLHLLLKVANHPALLLSQRNSTERKTNQFQMIHDKIFRTNQQYQQLTKESLLSLSNSKYCGKMKVLKELLDTFHKNHSKVLLFSYRTQLLDILEVYLQTALYEFCRIDGQVSPKNRSTIVQEFNNDPSIFICLISTKAGGLGLNITGANVVIIFDPNWNPSHDLQAQDRAYRIGQRRDVQVFRLISSCSIEENIYLRQVYKQQLEKVVIGTENAKRYFFGIQGDQQRKGELFGLKNMFSFSEKQSSLVENILERNKKVEKQLAGHKVTKYVSITVKQKETEESNDEWSDEEDFNIEDSSNDSDDNSNDDEEEMETESSSEEESPELMARGDSFKDLGNYGVVHIHKNRQITGASRAEDHMSKCAMEEVLQDQKNSQQLAMECEPYAQQSPDSRKTSKKRKKMTKIKDYNAPKCIPFGENQMIYGETPVAVVRDHLSKMVETLQFSSLEELCQSIIKMSAENRAELLQQFYTKMYGSQISTVFQKLPRFSKSLSTGSSQEESGQNQQKKDSRLTTQDNDQVDAVKKSLNSKTCRKKFTKLHHTHRTKSDFGNPFASPTASTSKTSDSACGNRKYLHHRHLVSDVKYSSNTGNSNSSLDSENPETNLPTVPVDSEAVIFTEADDIFFSESNPTNTHRKPPPKSKLKFKR